MRRASRVIISSVKELKHAITRSTLAQTHVDPYNRILLRAYSINFSSIPDRVGSSAPPASTADEEDDDSSASLSTSTSPSIDTKHR